jgi:hypothetical protein
LVVYGIINRELEDRHGLGQTVGDLHLNRTEAEGWLAKVLADDPSWGDQLHVVEIELAGEPFAILGD